MLQKCSAIQLLWSSLSSPSVRSVLLCPRFPSSSYCMKVHVPKTKKTHPSPQMGPLWAKAKIKSQSLKQKVNVCRVNQAGFKSAASLFIMAFVLFATKWLGWVILKCVVSSVVAGSGCVFKNAGSKKSLQLSLNLGVAVVVTLYVSFFCFCRNTQLSW